MLAAAAIGAGVLLFASAIVDPGVSILWAPGLLLTFWGADRHRTRFQRAARRRRNARGGYVA